VFVLVVCDYLFDNRFGGEMNETDMVLTLRDMIKLYGYAKVLNVLQMVIRFELGIVLHWHTTAK
jgi:hypothetical protein